MKLPFKMLARRPVRTLILCCLYAMAAALPFHAQASGKQLQGYILTASHSTRTVEGIRLEKYILRIRLQATRNSPARIVTAEMLVEPASAEESVIKSAREKHTLCGFVMHRQGMRYQLSNIYLLQGQEFGETRSSMNSTGTASLYGNAGYYDKAAKVLITTKRTLRKSASVGNDGISLGN